MNRKKNKLEINGIRSKHTALFQLVKNYTHAGVVIKNIIDKDAISLEIKQYIQEFDAYKEIERTITDTLKKLELVCTNEERIQQEDELQQLLGQRISFIKNVLSTLAYIEKLIEENNSYDQIALRIYKGEYEKALKLTNNLEYNPKLYPDNVVLQEKIKSNARKFELKGRLNLLSQNNILDSNILPSITNFNQGQISAKSSLDNTFYIDFIFRYYHFLITNDQLEYAKEKIEEYIDEILKINFSEFHEQIAYAYRQLGYINRRLNLFDLSLNSFIEAEKYYKLLKDKKSQDLGLAYLYNDIGLFYKQNYEASKAETFYKKSIEIKSKYLDASMEAKNNLSFTFCNLSLVYKQVKNYTEALSSINKAEELYLANKVTKDNFYLSTVLNNKATILNLAGNQKSAIFALLEVKKLREKHLDMRSNVNIEKLANACHNLGVLQIRDNQKENALNQLNKALSYYQMLYKRSQRQYTYQYFNCLISLASFHRQNNQYPKALAFLEKGLSVIDSSYTNIDIDKHKGRIYHNTSIIYFDIQDYEKANLFNQKSLNCLSKAASKSYDKNLHIKTLKKGITINQLMGNDKLISEYNELINKIK